MQPSSPATTSGPHEVPITKEGHVWYFAYGSNMNAKVLTGRRKVLPVASVPAKLDGYVLGFNLIAMPYREPGMATVQRLTPQLKAKAAAALPAAFSSSPAANGHAASNGHATSNGYAATNGYGIANGHDSGSTDASLDSGIPDGKLTSAEAFALRVVAGLHGVLHLITEDQWEIVKATEGVRVKGIGYQVVHVNCQLYDGRTVPALTLEAAPVSAGDITHFLPSVRYLNIIRDGARAAGLDPAYCAMLERHPAYEPPQGMTLKLANAGLTVVDNVMWALLLPLLAIAFVYRRVAQLLGVQPPSIPAFDLSTSNSSKGSTTGSSTTGRPSVDGVASTKQHKEQPEPGATALDRPAASNADANGGSSSEGTARASSSGAPAATKSTESEAKPPPGFKRFMMVRNLLDPRITSLFMFAMFRSMWLMHDCVLSPLLASGRNNNVQVMAARHAARKQQ